MELYLSAIHGSSITTPKHGVVKQMQQFRIGGNQLFEHLCMNDRNILLQSKDVSEILFPLKQRNQSNLHIFPHTG